MPLSTFVKLKHVIVPQAINHFQQLNSVTISGVAAPGISMGQALNVLQNIAANVLPQGYNIDYASQSRQYIKESSALVMTFILAMIIIFLSLSVLFNSFRDPLIVLISVPMSICGAMIFISLGIKGATLNIYTEVGLVTLIGLISKHGILIVQFANDLQAAGKSKREAAITAANVGTAADTISIEVAAGGVVFTAGAGGPLLRVQNMDTANAIASLADHVNDLITSLT